VLAGLVVLVDQITKAWVQEAFQLHETLSLVPGWFRLTYVRNPGAAFGLFSGQAEAFRVPFFLAVTAVALVAILVTAWRSDPGRTWFLAALGLVCGGAVGNLIDRLRWGEVVDFLDVYWRSHHWPAFNVADSAITVGVILLVAEELFGKKRVTRDE
jgi:signal peptidase II